MDKKQVKALIALHIMLMVYSCSSVLSKLASGEEFFNFWFTVYYVGVIALLGIYAIVWQQLIKVLPLTTAYANKAITVVWGIVWGTLFFKENVSVGKLVGAALVIAGVVLFAKSDDEPRGASSSKPAAPKAETEETENG